MLKKFFSAMALAPLLASCVGSQGISFSKDKSYGVYKIGKPYSVSGITYRPQKDESYREVGTASWYGSEFQGKATANGDRFDRRAVTAAHRTLPLPSLVRVKNMDNGKDLVVLVNDRGPFARGRILDVSERAADLLGFKGNGTARVQVTYLKGQTEEMLARMNGGALPGEQAPLKLAKRVDPLSFAVAANAAPSRPTPARALPPRDNVMPAPFAAAMATDEGVVPFAPVFRPARSTESRTATPFPVAKRDGYYIQAGTFTVSENAERSKQKLRAVAQVASVSQNNGAYTSHKVIVGPLGDKYSAERALENVRRMGFRDAMLIASSNYN
ncbi:MAG: septal ring lytic transglycosylase RlpA family protein [Rickettsiales bacterium]